MGRICFSDVTTYYSSYEHTFKNPLKRPAIRSTGINIVCRRQATKRFRYCEHYTLPTKSIAWEEYRATDNRALQSDAINRYGRTVLSKYLIPDPQFLEIYVSDKDTRKLAKYIYPKPKIVPDPVHPFFANDFPVIYGIYNRRHIQELNGFTLPTYTGDWAHRPSHTHTGIDRQRIRQYIYGELLRNWAGIRENK